MNQRTEYLIHAVVIFTGISSVTTQLLTIREFLARFTGNEFVISMVFFTWLTAGGLGTLLAMVIHEKGVKPTISKLGLLSFAVAALPAVQIFVIRTAKDFFFLPGTAVGFYEIFAYTILTTGVYCLLIGFVLPFSLYVLRRISPGYPGALVYITDNIGDVTGGAVFSLVLVTLVTPFQAILVTGLPLVCFSVCLFFAPVQKKKPAGAGRWSIRILACFIAVGILACSPVIERSSLCKAGDSLVHYKESRFGRITVHKSAGQYTLFMDGVPVAGSGNTREAEESAHYPLARIDQAENILLISAVSEIFREIQKHRPSSVDYVEIDPELTQAMFRYDLLERKPFVRVIHRDALSFLEHTDKMYDAVIMCLPEPATFQLNRFFTGSFFSTVKLHLTPGGMFSFTLPGFDNYMAKPDAKILSSVYNTVSHVFDKTELLPGGRVFFLCSDENIRTDIPSLLEKKGISTSYIAYYFSGDITPKRMNYLASQIDGSIPENSLLRPTLMTLVFSRWFSLFSGHPAFFFSGAALFLFVYFLRITRADFVLFSTAFANMGSEILTIFAFQTFVGYVYLKVGIIVTAFLAGLLPGAILGRRTKPKDPKQRIKTLEYLVIFLIILFALAIYQAGSSIPDGGYFLFGFCLSFVCGFQFSDILRYADDKSSRAASAFSADLVGAAFGALLTSTLLIPYTGLAGAAVVLILLKILSVALFQGKT